MVVMQFYRPPRTNPPSDATASFEAVVSPHLEVGAAVRRACGDCHSNETTWPWYSNVAPMSWLISRDVVEGRAHLNLSEWNLYGPEKSRARIADMCKEATAGEMPLWNYTVLHPNARLGQQDVTRLCALSQTDRASVR